MATSFARSGAAACIALSLIGVAYADPRTGIEEGIWKSAVPPHSMNGEFGNHDPIGLAAGAWIKTDCSLNWVDPDDHKLYCFNSATSVEYFRQWPKANIRRAKLRWETGS